MLLDLAPVLADIEADHDYLQTLLQNLEKASRKGGEVECVGHVLANLFDYTNSYFAREEEVMEKLGYPDLKKHRSEHKEITIVLINFLEEIPGSDDPRVEDSLLSFLKKWIGEHINFSDVEFTQ